MRRLAIRFGRVALSCALATSAAWGQSSVGVAGSLDRIVRAQVDSGFSGVVIVASHDSVVLRRAYNRNGSRLTADSPFLIASITKSFTSAAVLRLQSQGRLTVRDSLARFIPHAPADKRAITIHQLLTHTAGFRGASTGAGITSRDSAVRAILAQPLAYAPGHGYEYGNDDYQLLAAILEIATKRSWSDVVREEVLKPAGLRHTTFWSGTPDDWGHRGANGMSATADDLLAWTRVLHSRPEFSPIETPQVLVRREPPFDVSYSYGARIYSLDSRVVEVMHTGLGDDGNTSAVRVLRSGVTVVVLSSAGQHQGTTWSAFLATKLAPRQ